MTILRWVCLVLSSASAFTSNSRQLLAGQRTLNGSHHGVLSRSNHLSSKKVTTMTLPSRPKTNDGFFLRSTTTAAANNGETSYERLSLPVPDGRPLRIAIAGGGVGGLTAALCMLKRGLDVTVYEKTAAFARFGGPIQFASNALSVLKAIDDTLFDRVMEKFTFTGTRTCGIKDGLRADGSFRMTDDSLDYLWNPDAPADWFVKFPLKVRFLLVAICRCCFFYQWMPARTMLTIIMIIIIVAMCRLVWFALYRGD
jgi:FAD binding domain